MAATPSFSIDDFTLGEIATLEELSGLSLSEIADETAPKGKFLTALAYLAKRRENPAFTFSEAEMLKLSDVNEILAGTVSGEGKAA